MRRNKFLDRLGIAALPKTDETQLSARSFWWWILLGPGKFILWIQYMWPERGSGPFGSARRRNVPLVQVLYSLSFYGGAVLLLGFLLFSKH